ncbi:guanine nucleotide-binding protein subunit beta-2 [Cloeon dipterum]|uniref:guanine nucleotide-binding protein subunit beta-2 n=1 Tax=Cloeon dipterum TaxID=197152 RepID=UPI00321FBE74
MPKEDSEQTALRTELENLISSIQDKQKEVNDANLADKCGDMGDAPKIRLSTKKMLKGHINKVTTCHYSGDSRHAVTGSLDGKLIIWDTWTGNKVQVIPLRSSWVMSSTFAPSGNFVACGGMDNMCTVYDVNNRDASTGAAKMLRELLGYEGFLSSCRFIDDTHLITGSGDCKVCHWDLEANKKTMEFNAHCGDVVCISLGPDNNTYLTSSVDKTCRLWDMREEAPKQTFFGHEADVNSICYHPSGFGFATCSEDKTTRLFDIRSDQQVALYKVPSGNPGFTSCGLSKSGRMVLCGTDDGNVHSWDTLKTNHCGQLHGHENRVTSISVSPNGIALVSASWDMNVRVWG